jgi:hypothetical protein
VLVPLHFPDVPLPDLQTPDEFTDFLESEMQTWTQAIESRGEARGIARGKADSLSTLLRAKFGAESEEQVHDRLLTAEPEELDAWTSRILTAETIEELFGKP